MNRRRRVDASKVIEAVESGRLSQNVMDSYGLEKPAPPGHKAKTGRRGRPASTDPKETSYGEVTVNKRGSLVLPKSVVDQLELGEDDLFVVRRTKSGLLLKTV